MNTELLEALTILEKEKDISKETLLDAIENSLINACKNHFGSAWKMLRTSIGNMKSVTSYRFR